MIIHELKSPIWVETPFGTGKCICWIDYNIDTNTVWKVILKEDGRVRNFNDTEIRVIPNLMNEEKIVLPDSWKNANILNKK